jgi:hypothetical protein
MEAEAGDEPPTDEISMLRVRCAQLSFHAQRALLHSSFAPLIEGMSGIHHMDYYLYTRQSFIVTAILMQICDDFLNKPHSTKYKTFSSWFASILFN